VKVVFDASMLLYLFTSNVAPPKDSAGNPIDRAKERVDIKLAEISRNKDKIIVPTPALAEVLVRSPAAGPGYLRQ
jgi:hypothetical protein